MPRPPLTPLLSATINSGPWVATYALDLLKQRVIDEQVVLPICSLSEPAETLAQLGGLVLPPLYHEALAGDPMLKAEIVAQIRRCFPFFEGTRERALYRGQVIVAELPQRGEPWSGDRPDVLAFGADTTVEQHGPHLPLATDTVQTYAVLAELAAEFPGMQLAPPLEYGHLTWGLPFGMSVDLTAPLLGRYALGYINALVEHYRPENVYVADVHGSLLHRETIQLALRSSRAKRAAFRWLHDPLVEFGAARGDMHAGGVETALVAHIEPALVDAAWWPENALQLAAAEMTMADAIALSADMPAFIRRVEAGPANGIVGRIDNADTLDASMMFDRMVEVARADVIGLKR